MPTPRRTSTSSPSAPSFAAGLVRRRLANGAQVLCLPTGAADAPVALQLWVGAGAAAEGPSEHGCAHLLEHMLFKPFAAPPPGVEGDLARAIETLGGDVNAFTSHDETVIYATVPAPAWGSAIDAVLTASLRPALDAAEVEREREVVCEEIKQYDDEPGQRSVQGLLERIHVGHAYARPVLGLAREVRGHTARRLRAFHRRAYAGERLTLVVVGPVDPAQVLARARRLLLATGGAARTRTRERFAGDGERLRALVGRGDVQEAHLYLGWRTPGLGAADIAALDVATVVLGHGEASRLVREVRRRLRRVTDIHASLDIARESGTFLIAARTDADQVAEASEAVLLQVARLAAMPIAGEELARARSVLESDLIYRRETVQGLAHVLGYYQSLLGDPSREGAYFEALARLTVDDVQRAAATWLLPSRLVISTLVPEEAFDAADARGLRSALAEGGRRLGRTRPKFKEVAGIAQLQLECGLRVLIRRDPSLPIAAAWMTWLGGLRREPEPLAGLATATAALLTRGNARVDGDALSREVEGMAAVLDGFAGRSSMGLHGESLARSFPALLEHMLECALTPRFPEEELREEQRVALQEIAAADDDLGSQATRAFRALLFGDHPYHRSLRGTRAGVSALSSQILAREWRRRYPIGDAVLAIVGDVDPLAAVAALEGRLAEVGGRDRRGPGRLPGGPPAWPEAPVQRILRREREQAHVIVGYPGLTITDRRAPILEVMTTILGGQSGRLFQALREEEGLVYQVDASSSEGLDAGLFSVYAATSQDKVPRALAAIERHLARIIAEVPSEEELARAKAWLIGQHGIGLQRRSRVASQIALSTAIGEPPEHYLRYPDRIDRVRARDVLELARAIVVPARRAMAVVASRKASIRG